MESQLLRDASKRAILGQFGTVRILEEQAADCLGVGKNNWKQSMWFFTQKSHPNYIEETHGGVTAQMQDLE